MARYAILEGFMANHTGDDEHTSSSHRKSDGEEKTHFGFLNVPVGEKAGRVAAVFHSVAERYDLMNDLMSLGTHRIMKQMTIEATRARQGHVILDLAGGTGDLVAGLSRLVGDEGQVCLCDINGSMLRKGRDRLINRDGADRVLKNVTYLQADGEQLPFPDATFNAVTIAFGLRNMTDKQQALTTIHAALKPGGRLVVLEFSRPENPIVQKLFDGFNRLWPKVGKAVAGDSDSYRYLVESIKMHPDQQTLSNMMTQAGFTRVKYQNLLNGVAAIHEGMRSRS